MRASQSLENGRGRAFEALGTNDPRANREAAWRFVEAQKDFANPAYGRGADEIDFSEGLGFGFGQPKPSSSPF